MISQLTCRIDSNSIKLSIIQLVQKILFLNQKQFLIVKKILNHVIYRCKKIIVKAENQMFFYIDDENDVKKFQVIQIIKFEYELLQQKKKILLMTFTDNSVYNIDKHTIHNILVIDFCNHTQNKIKKNQQIQTLLHFE